MLTTTNPQPVIWEQTMQTLKLPPFVEVNLSQQGPDFQLETPSSLQSEGFRVTPTVSLERVLGEYVMRAKISHKSYGNY